MARLTFHKLGTRPYLYGILSPYHLPTELQHGAVSCHAIVELVTTHCVMVGGFSYRVPVYVLADGQELPELPEEITCYTRDDGRRALCVNVPHLLHRIGEALEQAGEDFTQEAVRVRAIYEFRCFSPARLITCHFSIHDPVDRETQFLLAEPHDQIAADHYYNPVLGFYDPDHPWLGTRALDGGSCLIHGSVGVLVDKLRTHTGRHYTDAADQHFATPTFVRARKAFAVTRVEPERLQPVNSTNLTGRRQLVLDDGHAVFPLSCRFMLQQGPLLWFEMVGETSYRVPCIKDGGRQDWVFIHRGSGCTRYLFLDYFEVYGNVAWPLPMRAVFPIAVDDTECAKTVPVSPMRGMDPRVTQALATTPYLASSFQHAMHRRRYLRSKIDLTSKQVPAQPEEPVLFRAADGLFEHNEAALRPSRYSRLGRKMVRSGDVYLTKTIYDLLVRAGRQQIMFDEVQPVAAEEKRNQRALSLDM